MGLLVIDLFHIVSSYYYTSISKPTLRGLEGDRNVCVGYERKFQLESDLVIWLALVGNCLGKTDKSLSRLLECELYINAVLEN